MRSILSAAPALSRLEPREDGIRSYLSPDCDTEKEQRRMQRGLAGGASHKTAGASRQREHDKSLLWRWFATGNEPDFRLEWTIVAITAA